MYEPPEIWEFCYPRLKEYYRQQGDIAAVAEFVGATKSTVSKWLNGDNPAQGERLLKLWHFLYASGCPTPEFKKLNPYSLYLGQLFAFGVIDMNLACQAINVRHAQAVFQTIRGSYPARPTYVLDDLKMMYEVPLNRARGRITRVDFAFAQAAAPEAPDAPYAPPVAQVATAVTPSSVDPTFVLKIAGELQQSLVLFRFLDSDDCPEETRALVLQMTGDLSEFSALIGCIQSRSFQ